MGVHIAIVGNGRIGRPTAYTLFNELLVDEISLIDIKPGLSWAFGEELKHVAASLKYDVKINSYEDVQEVSGADLIVICAGKPRLPGTQISRRDLVVENSKIINSIANIMPQNNHGAKYVIITNPVDAMATLFRKISKINFTIGTGDHPDTIRFRNKLAIALNVPVSTVKGYIGGEHGSAACALWSTVRIKEIPLEEYLKTNAIILDKATVVDYIKAVPMKIVNVIGATEFGPAAAFRDIIKSIILDKGEVYSVAVATKLLGLPEVVNINVPIQVGQTLGPNLWGDLKAEEQNNIIEAAKVIYENYMTGVKAIEELSP